MRAAAVVLMLLAGATNCPADPPAKPSQSCAEDDPCWDCRTMGNKQCSPGERRGGAA